MDFEIGIAGDMIRQEAHTAFQRHHLGGKGQHPDLRRRQPVAALLQKASGVLLEQIQITGDQGEIPLILGGGIGAETDAVAEIIQGETGHDGVQIDDADRAAGNVVQHDVVELGVVVRHPQGQLAGGQHIHQHPHVRLTRPDEGDFLRCLRRPAGGVFRHGGFKIPIPGSGIVKVGDRFVQGGGGIVRQQPLKAAEGTAGIIEMLRFGGGLIGDGVFDEDKCAPIAAVGRGVIGLSGFGGNQGQAFPVGIAAVRRHHPAQIGGDIHHVLHQGGHVLEDVVVHPLENIAAAGRVFPLAENAVGIVDVAAAVGLGVDGFTLQGENVWSVQLRSFLKSKP